MTIQVFKLLQLRLLFATSLVLAVAYGRGTQAGNARELLNRSPWAVPVEATMDDPADVPEISNEVPRSITQAGQPNVGNGNMDTNTRWDGQIGKTRMGRLATIPVLVRWDSASVMRHALAQRHEADEASLASAAENHYVLTVVGLLPARTVKTPATIEPRSASEAARQPTQTTEEILEWFMGNSLLLTKGQPAARPENVQVDADSGAVHLYFRRNAQMLAGKREVDFATRYGAMAVQARFRLKDMQVGGHPDL